MRVLISSDHRNSVIYSYWGVPQIQIRRTRWVDEKYEHMLVLEHKAGYFDVFIFFT